MDYSLLKKDLDERGYFRVSINPCIPLLENLRAKIFSVNNCLSESKNLGKISDDRDIVNFRLKNQSLQYLGVKHLWNSSALFSLGGHPYFEELLKSICKFKEPIHNVQPLLRVDLPIKELFLDTVLFKVSVKDKFSSINSPFLNKYSPLD